MSWPRCRSLTRAASLAAVLATFLVVLPAAADAKGSRGGPFGPLVNEGRWMTDAHGKVVILHGLNMVYKRPPYHPGAVGFGADDARFLARNGFNTVRLGLIYAAVEPQPGQYDGAYVERLRRLERKLYERGIYSMIDFHQDLYNERFEGEGWPAWATLDDGVPAQPLTGFPTSYVTSPGLNRAFDNFWADAAGPGGIGLQERYAAAWARVARAFRSDDGVMGYDVMNEPWPGSDFATCANTEGCPEFDRGPLAAMHRKVIRGIREHDRTHIVFNEPHVLFNFGSDTSLPDLGPNQGFSFHDYCLTGAVAGGPGSCEALDALVFDNADAHAERTGDSLMLSEFGATEDVATLERIAGLADEHMVSWQEWHYCGCDDPTTQGPGDVQALVKDPARPPRGSNVFRDKLEALARPYPQVIAGTPRSYGFNPETRRFHLSYTRERVSGRGSYRRGRTLVFAPRVQYPDGYRVRVQGGSVARRSGPRVTIRADRGSKAVSVVVSPR